MDKVKMAPSEPLEQGFNDDELANIMSEIEDLEKEFMAEPVAAASKEEPIPEPVMDEDAPKMVDQNPELEVEKLGDMTNASCEGVSEEAPKQIAVQDAILKKTELQEQIDKELNSAFSVPVSEYVAPSVVHPMPNPTPSPAAVCSTPSAEKVKHATFTDSCSEKSRMSFHVEGNMSMELSFSFGENEVTFSVQEGEGFVIEMGNGAKFTIPFEGFSQTNKKAS